MSSCSGVISPFAFRQNLHVSYNESRTLSVPAYIAMYAKGVFTKNDLLALKHTYRYGYITRRMLSRLVDTTDNCKALVRKLKTNGLLVKCSITANSDVVTDYYVLSKTGMAVCSNSALKFKRGEYFNASDCGVPANVLSSLALNNLRAGVESGYGDYMEKAYYNYEVVIDKVHITSIPVMWLFRQDDKRVLVVPVSVRRSRGWRSRLNGLLDLYKRYFREHFEGRDIVICPVVEDSLMACECYAGVNLSDNIAPVPILFITDYAANSDEVFSNLINVKDGSGNFDIVELNFK